MTLLTNLRYALNDEDAHYARLYLKWCLRVTRTWIVLMALWVLMEIACYNGWL